jgi:hypothetical protein
MCEEECVSENLHCGDLPTLTIRKSFSPLEDRFDLHTKDLGTLAKRKEGTWHKRIAAERGSRTLNVAYTVNKCGVRK